jgi:CHAT domain-containing protein
MLLRDSNVRFVYLSCCRGTTTSAAANLVDNDFLGIADGIIHAGVPAVLGFRWPVSDSGAKTLALEFYTSLAKQGQLDTALLDARREVATRNRDDITWLSPILIMQA